MTAAIQAADVIWAGYLVLGEAVGTAACYVGGSAEARMTAAGEMVDPIDWEVDSIDLEAGSID